MKVVIIDDEKAMHLILKRMLSKLDNVEIIGTFQDTATASAYLKDHDVDLILVDINMPKESGLEFAARLREDGRQVNIVFVTSHVEYSLPAFDVYAFDYIVKPVNYERLQRTIQRAQSSVIPTYHSVQNGNSPISITFHFLGGMEIRTAQNIVVRWNTSKSAELFGYLLIHKGRLVTRARIIEDIFGDMPNKNSETYLNTTVYQLRKLLDRFGLKESLYSDNNHYALNIAQISVDSCSFEEGCKQIATVDSTNIDQALELEQLYNGDLFGERVFPWARGEVERLSQLYTSLTHRLCDALLTSRETQIAIRLLIKLTAHNELDEETIKLHMRALALMKKTNALNRLYVQFGETLYSEMGIEPSKEVTALYNELMMELQV